MSTVTTVTKVGKKTTKNAKKNNNAKKPVTTVVKKTVKTNQAAARSAKARPAIVGGGLSPVATLYGQCLADPFDGPIAGVPNGVPILPSYKARYFAKGTITVGSGGVGFVVFNPFYGLANNSASVYYSGAGPYAGTTIALTGVGVISANTNSDYAIANFDNINLSGRVVAAGVRVYPTMAEVDLNGLAYGVRQLDNGTLSTYSETNIIAQVNSLRMPITSRRTPLMAMYVPVNPSELDFDSVSTPHSSQYCLGIMVVGTAGKTFSWEVAVVGEMVGPYARGLTPSLADPVGMSAILDAAEMNNNVTATTNSASYSKSFTNAAGALLKDLSWKAAGAAARGLTNYVTNNAFESIGLALGPSHGGRLQLPYRSEFKRRALVSRDGRKRYDDLHWDTDINNGRGAYDGSHTTSVAVDLKPRTEFRVEAEDGALLEIAPRRPADVKPSLLPGNTFPVTIQGKVYEAVGYSNPQTDETLAIIEFSTTPECIGVYTFANGQAERQLALFSTYDDAFYYCIVYGYNQPWTPSHMDSETAVTITRAVLAAHASRK